MFSKHKYQPKIEIGKNFAVSTEQSHYRNSCKLEKKRKVSYVLFVRTLFYLNMVMFTLFE